jgi:hypothetical protein
MTEPPKTSGESSFKNQFIISDIRQQIVGGELTPGSQLATRNELEQYYQVSRDTVQRALDQLVEEDFVYTNGRRGTYVSPHPPHLSNYALIFESQPGGSPEIWSQFEETLLYAATHRPPSPEQHITVYHDVKGTRNSPDYEQLERDVLNHRLAGLIFTFDPVSFRGTPLMQVPGVTRVAIVSEPLEMPTVNFSMFSFIDRALDFIVAKGRRRVAVVSHMHSSFKDNRHLADGIAARGLVYRRYWMQTANVKTADSADECVHLLMHPGQNERPDAVIIDNDNLLEPAIRGLLAAGVKVPEDIEVVTHANFPLPGASPLAVPVTRLGFDMRRVLDACFDSMNAHRLNLPTTSTTIGALFQSEISL